jgi:S-adenosylmethionine:tRNA ribosyltransferase-isomerase
VGAKDSAHGPRGSSRRLESLGYRLPKGLIAQHPTERREDSRLLVVERRSGLLRDAQFSDLPEWLHPGDVLAINETRVRPARLMVRRVPTGGKIELLFVRPESAGAGRGAHWRVLVRPARVARVGARLETASGSLGLEVAAAREGGERTVRVLEGDLEKVLAREGEIPLPPYLKRAATAEDRVRYQTVYAKVEGAVAAPTAGLHFSAELFERLARDGVSAARVLLHVGPGTFRPITAADPKDHKMDEEYFEVSDAAATMLKGARSRGARAIAVGTTVVRALESACDQHGGVLGPARGWTRKFILPPYRFHGVDALITNFHLPRTTLLLLVAAFAGEQLLMKAYQHAIQERYRFYSYGDAMLVL